MSELQSYGHRDIDVIMFLFYMFIDGSTHAEVLSVTALVHDIY